ncbi:MAG: DUF3868 domain-containing protein [Muribaculaceae bacterium]|nr:DUF3868 domain-containing protein [Muribaculaceae bacterium]
MTRNFISFVLILASIMAGCALSLSATGLARGSVKVKTLRSDSAAGKLFIGMQLSMDSLQLARNASVTYTPLLISADSTNHVAFPPVLVNSRNQHILFLRDSKGFKGTELQRHNGKQQSVDYFEGVDMQPWMENATLYLADDLCGCGDLLSSDKMLLAVFQPEPVAQPEPVVLDCFLVPEVEARKQRSEKGRAFVDFKVNRTEIHPDYRGNSREIDKIVATIQLVRNNPDVTINSVSIHGYASPEGSYANNTRLASGRAKALADYVRMISNLDGVDMTIKSTPEDWDGLRAYVDSTHMQDRERMLALIDSDMAPDTKDATLKRNFPQQYAFLLSQVYPALRHSDYEVTYTVRPFSVEEARQVILTDPRKLSLNEMYLVAQSYPAGSSEYNEVFEIAVRLYPSDPVANLNAAITAVNRGDTAAARRYIKQAANLPQAAKVMEAIETLESRGQSR